MVCQLHISHYRKLPVSHNPVCISCMPQVASIRGECNVDVTLTERKKRDGESGEGGDEAENTTGDETEDEAGETTEDETEDSDDTTQDDTTGDSDSSSIARDGDSRSIPFGLVDDLFELSGAFQYGM